MLTPEAMLTLAADLTDAAADSDAGSLAAIAWRLYGEAGENLAEIGRLRAAVHAAWSRRQACRLPPPGGGQRRRDYDDARDGKLYATDDFANPGLYRVGPTTGLETAVAAVPFGFSSGLELMNPGG